MKSKDDPQKAHFRVIIRVFIRSLDSPKQHCHGSVPSSPLHLHQSGRATKVAALTSDANGIFRIIWRPADKHLNLNPLSPINLLKQALNLHCASLDPQLSQSCSRPKHIVHPRKNRIRETEHSRQLKFSLEGVTNFPKPLRFASRYPAG